MTPAALTAVPEPHELESDRVEAAPMLRRELRAVDPCPDEAAVSPRSRPHHVAGELVVPRPELYARLTGAARVTQLSAGAGSGKTVLLQSWIDHSGLAGRAAGLFLDHEERDAQRFWLSVRQALHGTTAGEALVGELTAAGNLDGWTIIDRLTDDLTPLREAVWVVIDGVDELRTDELRHQLEYFIKSAPRQVRFVLSSRSDPHLGLHRLRVYGDLTELRTPDLRFTETEARALFESIGIRLSDVALKQLLERTDGWAGGLRLAAIAMAGHGDPERFASEFSGSERTVAAYLLAEVLERQPAEVRELLLHTSLLDRVSGPLADYVTGGSGAERTLLELEDANAFVTSIDAGRSWFRYHRLFAEFLRLELRRAYPTAVRSLHRAAADWFEREGDAIEAIRHAQAACDWRRAAHLLLDHRIALILEGRLASLRELLHAFPAQAIADDSELAVTFACVGLRDGLLDEADAYIASAERHAADVAEERAGQLELHLASVRLAAATQRGDLCAARHAMHALEAARAARPPAAVRRAEEIRALALMTLGTSELWSLELADARRHLQEGLTLARRIERPYLEVGCLAHLAIAAPLSGQSASAALDLTEDAVAVAEANGLATDPIVALAFAIGAGSLAWLGRFDDAERWLERAEQALDSNRDPGTELALHHARGLLHSGQGRLEEALSSFRRAEDVQALLIGQHALTVDLRMRIILTHVRMGAVAEARAALDGLAATERDRAESHIAAAAVHLAEGDPERAAELLVPVTELSVAALIPAWAAVHGLLLNALAQEQLGDRCAAEASVERALELAEPGGLILPFAIFPIQDMLERHPRHRTAHAALRVAILDVLGGAAAPPRGEPALLVDDLSEAELRVLRYLPSNLRAPEIASELYISTNTVRTHVRHIYAKLDAHGRAEAVARGRQLGLLAPVRRLR